MYVWKGEEGVTMGGRVCVSHAETSNPKPQAHAQTRCPTPDSPSKICSTLTWSCARTVEALTLPTSLCTPFSEMPFLATMM